MNENTLVNDDSLALETVFEKYSKEAKKISYNIIKRIFDLICSLIGIILMLPIIIAIKISYILNKDYKSIFYTQKRIGKNGKIYNLYKFRSMAHNASEILEELLKDPNYKKEWEENQKFENDPRITKAGKMLRKTSIDEIPQFINVLKGDMSIIGPRPLVIGELDAHHGNHELYESVKPGISGWWGCNGRSSVTYAKRLELEYYYCKNCSLMLDIKCIFKTIKVVLSKDGAK